MPGGADGCQIGLRHLLQKFGRLGAMPAAARERGAKLGKGLLQRGQQLGADAIARIARVGIGRVFHPRLATRRKPVTQDLAGQIKQRTMPFEIRPAPLRRHGSQPGHTGAARQGQQQRLDLVVRMLRQRHAANGRQGISAGALHRPGFAGGLYQRCVAQLACGVLRTLARRVARVHAANLQRNGMLSADFLALADKGIGRRLQTVVHMDGHDLARPALGAGQQQRRGVRSAAEGHGQRQLRRKAMDGRVQSCTRCST